MTRTLARRAAVTAAVSALAITLSACGGNVGGSTGGGTGGSGDGDAAAFPDGPITMLVGQDPGGSTDVIARAIADLASEDLGVPISVENVPGANGAIAARQLAGEDPDGTTIMTFVGTLAYITPIAVGDEEAVDIADYSVVTGISQDDYVLVTSPDSGIATVEDLVAQPQVDYGTTGVGTGSQLATALLMGEAGVDATAVPFDGGSPTLTAVLGGQVDVAAIQVGEAAEQIEAGDLVPLVTFAAERNEFLPDVPTAVESGYDGAEVQQSRAVVAPGGTPDEVVTRLQEAFDAAFADSGYQEFNDSRLLVPNEVAGDEVVTQWTDNLERYRGLVEEYGIQLGEQ
ncbi:Bug family tripartite tricarboxylate transporter substrate binding protein [Pseudokineococcus lusitanus]|uniref:Tripartite-type tricarboxylate transporter receptor subunit TctC n=1 Tax=Pseudokineococcus lusitanus TaxID=763993 RepID=A0A3N1HRI2_9ACTN|nr:tripartite tricarboxylate transporter substrate binding protein [Pseudokineococcus lusitanus]ROP45010.1 tripartite-type tricarboxylate transporter receptor subunit TctC [Pseudokineococcus lusitanus]